MSLSPPSPLQHGLCAALCIALVGSPLRAEHFHPVTSRSDFLAIVQGAQLTALGVAFEVRPDGRLTGTAVSGRIRGTWTWTDGFFCRSGQLGERQMTPDCTTVEVLSQTLRLTARKGEGKSRDYWIRR